MASDSRENAGEWTGKGVLFQDHKCDSRPTKTSATIPTLYLMEALETPHTKNSGFSGTKQNKVVLNSHPLYRDLNKNSYRQGNDICKWRYTHTHTRTHLRAAFQITVIG